VTAAGPPRFIEPMLARSGAVPDGDGWALEVKFDGIRAQLRVDGSSLCLRSRPGRDRTSAFPELAALAGVLGRRRVILDGELVCFSENGDPDFERLRARLRSHGRAAALASSRAPATFLAFDLLHLDGRSTLRLPYAARRELLERLELEGPAWRTPRGFVGQAAAVLAATAECGLEGVVAKRLDSPYAPRTRGAAWVKHKHRRSEPFVITAWAPAQPRRPESFLLARRLADGGLEPAGSVSLGLPGEARERLRAAGRRAAAPKARPTGATGGARDRRPRSTFTCGRTGPCGTPCCGALSLALVSRELSPLNCSHGFAAKTAPRRDARGAGTPADRLA
jgi:bifunctional non-homologous end joining protein LigD